MTYRGIVYFHGPKTAWSKQIDEDEIIARIETRFLWLALWFARNTHKGLDRSRCGYAVTSDTETLEHVEAA